MRIDTKAILRLLRRGLSAAEVAKALGCSIPSVHKANQKSGYKGRPQTRRFFRTPQDRFDQFEQLIRDTELSAVECARQSGINNASLAAETITHKYRDYISSFRWIDRRTGELRPKVCTVICASEKIKLSRRTITRRLEKRLIATRRAPNSKMRVFSSVDLVQLAKLGKLKPGTSRLTPDDVDRIRQQAATGKTHGEIARALPQTKRVSRRQISRIVDGTRWKAKR